jgi:hypothetical protein
VVAKFKPVPSEASRFIAVRYIQFVFRSFYPIKQPSYFSNCEVGRIERALQLLIDDRRWATFKTRKFSLRNCLPFKIVNLSHMEIFPVDAPPCQRALLRLHHKQFPLQRRACSFNSIPRDRSAWRPGRDPGPIPAQTIERSDVPHQTDPVKLVDDRPV